MDRVIRTQLVATSQLTPHSRNARHHPEKQMALLTKSILRWGVIKPIVADENFVVLAGHGILEACKRCKISEVPVVQISDLSDADKRAYLLADNRLGELSNFQRDMLAEELSFLVDVEFDLDVTGFDMGDIDMIVGLPETGKKEEPPVELPDPTASAISRLGDLWHIGPHRLYCGDSRNPLSYEQLLGGDLAQMVFADPPYNVPINGHVSGLGKAKHREFAMASGEQTDAEFITFLRTIKKLLVRHSIDGSIHYICMDWRHARHVMDAAEGVYTQQKNLAVWNKTNAGMGSFYRSRHELIFIYKSGSKAHINNFGLGENGRYRTNVWDYAGANTFRKGRDADLEAHSTVKPIGLVADAILDCSHRGALILDPFAGSGTTLIAAHRTGRRGAAIEIDPLYIDTALRRLEAATGLNAVHADGDTFAQKAQSRAANLEENI